MTSHQSAAARQAGWLFVVSGVIGLANDALPSSGHARLTAVALDLLNAAVGVLALALPWRRWSLGWTLALPMFALVNLGLNLRLGLLPASTTGVWLVLVFVWVGLWHAPRTAFMLAPGAALAFVVPLALDGSPSGDAVGAVALGIPVAVLVAETIARKEAATRVAQDALTRASLTDDLTGLGNRRRADLLLDALAEGDALVILDLDHFKDVNDAFGHERGDDLLRDLGVYLAGAVRGDDLVARFGGEEFVVTLRSAGPAASATIERLLAGWRSTAPLATLSAGMAVHAPGDSPRDTFGAADAALYEAKAAGRDRLVLAA